MTTEKNTNLTKLIEEHHRILTITKSLKKLYADKSSVFIRLETVHILVATVIIFVQLCLGVYLTKNISIWFFPLTILLAGVLFISEFWFSAKHFKAKLPLFKYIPFLSSKRQKYIDIQQSIEKLMLSEKDFMVSYFKKLKEYDLVGENLIKYITAIDQVKNDEELVLALSNVLHSYDTDPINNNLSSYKQNQRLHTIFGETISNNKEYEIGNLKAIL